MTFLSERRFVGNFLKDFCKLSARVNIKSCSILFVNLKVFRTLVSNLSSIFSIKTWSYRVRNLYYPQCSINMKTYLQMDKKKAKFWIWCKISFHSSFVFNIFLNKRIATDQFTATIVFLAMKFFHDCSK